MVLYRIIAGSLRAKLLLAVAATTALILTLFVVSVAIQERNDVLRTNREFAMILAGSLANSTAEFLASHDVLRLQEISNAQNNYDDLSYALFTDQYGEILAHTDTTKVGLFLANLPKELKPVFYAVQHNELTDVMHPVFLGNMHVGWICLGISNRAATQRLLHVLRKGVFYILLATFIAVLISFFTARHITRRLSIIENNIKQVKAGSASKRNKLTGFDETARLAAAFDNMLEVLQIKEQDLLQSRNQFQELFNAAQVPMLFVAQGNPDKIFTNRAFTELFGYTVRNSDELELFWLKAYPDATYRAFARTKWENIVANAIPQKKDIAPDEYIITDSEGNRHNIIISGKFIDDMLLVVFHDVTESRRTEHLLRSALQKAEQFRAALDLVPSYIYMKDTHGTYIYANKRTLQLFGCTPETLHTIKDEVFFPPETAALLKRIDAAVLQGSLAHNEIPVRFSNGKEIVYLEVKGPMYDEKTGEIIGLVGISTDITSAREAALKEKAEREKLEKIAGRLPGVIYQFRLRPDGSSCFPYASEAIRDVYEVAPEDVKEDASIIFKNIHPEDLEPGLQSIRISAETLKPWSYEFRYIAKSGVIKYLKGNAIPQKEPDGSVLWHGFIADVTDVKLAELEWNKTLELNNNILKLVPAGIFWKDRELRYMGANEIFLKDLGVNTTSEVFGKDDFDLVPYEAALRYRKTDLEVLLSEQPVYGLKESFTTTGGELRYILINKTPLRNQYGAVIGILGTYIDITALTEAEEKLKATTRLYLLISQLNQMFIRQKDEAQLLQETCNMAVQYGGFLMSWIGKVNEETEQVVPLHIAGKEDGYFQAISGISAKDIPIGRGPTGTSIRERRLVYSEDIANDPMMLPWREEALKRGYRSSLSVPILVNDVVKYTLTLYSGKPHHFNDEQETQLIQEIADDLSFTLTAFENERQKAAAEKRAADYIYALNESAIVDISDSAGRITFANENFYRITGYTPEEIMGQDHKILNSKYHDKMFYENLWGTILKGRVWRGEVRNKTKDGRLFWVDTTIVPFLDERGKPVQFISIRNDITDRKNAEAEKLMLLERYELITQATSDTMWDLDVTTNTIVYNQNYTKIYGYKQRVHTNSKQWFQEHVHPDDWPRVKALIDRTFRFKRHKMQDQYRYRCADGTYKYVLDRAFVQYDAGGNPVRIIGSMQDITKERELNQQIEKAVIAAQENEWNQLGMELHDNVNQILAASMIYLNFAEEKIKEGKDAVQEIKKSEDLLRNAVQEIRRLSHQLAPASVDKMNIRQVIETLVESLGANNRFAIHLDLQQAGELPMTANLQTQLFRILQEQFNNIIKHAHARNVTISLRKTANALVMRVADDGKGKDLAKSERTTGIGLENIRRRVTALGGSMHIYTAPGKGFTIEVVVPLEKI